MVRLVSEKNRISLTNDFDASQKVKLWLAFAAAHERFISVQGTGIGRDTFLTYIVRTIVDVRDEGTTIYDPSSLDGELNVEVMTSKTLYNFLSNDQKGILRTHPRTLRFVEAFLGAKSGKSLVSYRRESFVDTLGAATSIQYSSPKSRYPKGWSIHDVGDSALFQYSAPSTLIPGPMQARDVLVFVKRVKHENFLLFRVLPLPGSIEFSRFSFSDEDLSDWGEEPFSGIGTYTRDGLSCHMTSINVKIPLYMFIRPADHKTLECSFISYEAPGYLLPYHPLNPLNREDVLTYFDNLPWIL